MNKNIKTLLNVLPIILIPLFTERKILKNIRTLRDSGVSQAILTTM